MARYIDADLLIKKVFPIGLVSDGNYSINAKAVKKAIDNTPTADVVEVKHGEWISATPSGGYDFYCSCCKEFAITYEDNNYREQYHLTNYCPNCGAKMDGKKGGEADA
jgi:hypothetical protein